MDQPVPASSPTHISVPGDERARPFAQGASPVWTLAESGRGVALSIAGGRPVQFGTAEWRDSPLGRTMTATGTSGTLLLRVKHGQCQGASGLLVVLEFQGFRMTGCLLTTGNRPYGGGG